MKDATIAWMNNVRDIEVQRLRNEGVKPIPLAISGMSCHVEKDLDDKENYSVVNKIAINTGMPFDLIKQIMLSDPIPYTGPSIDASEDNTAEYFYVNVLLFTNHAIPIILPYVYKSFYTKEDDQKKKQYKNTLKHWILSNAKGTEWKHHIDAFQRVGSITRPLNTFNRKIGTKVVEVDAPVKTETVKQTTELIPAQEHAPNLSQTHASPVQVDGQLFWIPPVKELTPKEVQQATKNTARSPIMGNDGTADDFIHYLPPPPRYNLNSQIPEHVQQEKEILRILDERLPPNDIFRIAVACNKPWFKIALWSYCAVAAVCVILFGKWDELNEGHPHVFQPIQKWYRDKIAMLQTVDKETEQKMILEKLKQQN